MLLLPEEDKLAGPDVDVVEGNDDCGERVDGDDDEDDGDEESEGVAEARAAARRTRMAVDRMTAEPANYRSWGRTGKGGRTVPGLDSKVGELAEGQSFMDRLVC